MDQDIFIFFKNYFRSLFYNIFKTLSLPSVKIFFVYFKIFSFCLSIYFLIGIFIYIKKLKIILKLYNKYLNVFGFSSDYLSTKRCQKKWKEIENLLKEPYESSWKLSVLKAFSTVKNLLELLGYPQDFKEAIKKLSKEDYKNLEVIEKITEITEKILNDKNFSLNKEEAERIVAIYKKFFQEILISIS